MHHVATMPALERPGKTVIVYRCETCERIKWIEQ
jgi:hypothetical protein